MSEEKSSSPQGLTRDQARTLCEYLEGHSSRTDEEHDAFCALERIANAPVTESGSDADPAGWPADEVEAYEAMGAELEQAFGGTTECRSVTQETIEDAWSVATWHLEALKMEDDADGDEAATCRRLLRAIPRHRVPWIHPNQKLEEQARDTEHESVDGAAIVEAVKVCHRDLAECVGDEVIDVYSQFYADVIKAAGCEVLPTEEKSNG